MGGLKESYWIPIWGTGCRLPPGPPRWRPPPGPPPPASPRRMVWYVVWCGVA